MPFGSVRLMRRRVLHGPNRWSRLPVVHLQLDLGGLEHHPTDHVPGLTGRLIAAMPGLAEHGCSEGRPGGLVHRLEEGTWMGHVIEHVALEAQRMVGGRPTRGKTRAAGRPGVYDVIFAFEDEAVGMAAGEGAIELVNRLIEPAADDPPPSELVAALVERLLPLVERGRLGLSTQAIVDVARRRHIPVRRLNDRNLLQLGWGARAQLIRATVTSATSLIGAEMARDKDEMGAMLARAGVPTPPWRLATDEPEAVAAARILGMPVVVKPVDGNHGRAVTLDVSDELAAAAAFRRAQGASRRKEAIVQEQMTGRDYRILVIGQRMVACAERVPAGVDGDGVQSVAELIERANADPRRGVGHRRELTRIPLDASTRSLLEADGLAEHDTPGRDQHVRLARVANLSTGGTSIDRTDEVHPDVAAMAVLAARVIGLDIAGIDVVTTDITRPLIETGGAVIEINAGPGFRMHTHPMIGRGRNIGGAVLDHLFGPGEEGRIPVAAVTGSNGKTTTVRLLAHLLATSGVPTGLTTTEDVVADGLVLGTGDMAGPASARLLLGTPTIEAAVLEVARGGILRDGLGYDYNDVAVVTNVTGDHLGLGGIDTLEQLAEVKAVIVDAVPRTGTAVLNADDPLVLAMAHRCRGAVALTTIDPGGGPGGLTVARHLAEGGLAGRIEWREGNEHLVIVRGGVPIVDVALEAIPLTLDGAARMHVANALAAATAAAAMGLDGEVIEEGLRSFERSPGRVERHRIAGRDVILDYGHNIAALRAIKELIERVAEGRRIVGVVSMPGDRRDEDRSEFGALAGSIFDRLFVAEPAVRGRPVGQAAALLIEAASRRADGQLSRAATPTFIADEADAAVAALQDARSGELVVLCVANGERVVRALEALHDDGL